MKTYCGIGSRQSPHDIIKTMTDIGEFLAQKGWLLRSGSAAGADLAFEIGADKVNGKKEIFLPWKNFNNSNSPLYTPSPDAFVLASTIHPAWNYLSQGAKKLHARNCHQCLGIELDDPVDLVICWTPNGKEVGGTATALKLAHKYNIRIINLATEVFDFNGNY